MESVQSSYLKKIGKNDEYFQMNAQKIVKILSIVLYFLYLIFFGIESQGSGLRYTSRTPASFVAVDQVGPQPVEKKALWIQGLLVPDSAGILRQVKNNIQKWQQFEHYRNTWNVESSGLYNTPDRERKQKYLTKTLLKYGDKRLSGELKKAEAGTTLHRIKSAEKALAPKIEAKIAKNIRIKFRARVLQSNGTLFIHNPYVSYHVNFHTSGSVNMHLGKKIKKLGLHAKLDYNVDQEKYIAQLNKRITRNISSTLSSSQSVNKSLFSQESERALRLNYTSRFP